MSVGFRELRDLTENPESKIIGIAENKNQTITGGRLDGSYNIFVVKNNDKEYYIYSIVISHKYMIRYIVFDNILWMI